MSRRAKRLLPATLGVVSVAGGWLLRLRYNPFYSVLETRVLDWTSNAH